MPRIFFLESRKTREAPLPKRAQPRAWPADQVERRPIAALIPSARNARTHSEEQVRQIAASIARWGWTSPVLVDEAGEIIAGHGRVLAAERLAIADAPVMTARGWSDAEKRAYRIADNKLALNAGWDPEALRLELGELRDIEFDLSLVGFAPLELDELFGGGGPTGAGQRGLGSLAERFGVPPFSVLNAREGWWQDRKRAWLAIGIQSELGRGEQAEGYPNQGAQQSSKRANAIPGGGRRCRSTEQGKARQGKARQGKARQLRADR